MASLNSGMKNRGDPAIVLFTTLLRQFHVGDHPVFPQRIAGGSTAPFEHINTALSDVVVAEQGVWHMVIYIHEDNTSAISGAASGKNPTMKTLERCFGVSVAKINERMRSGDYFMVHTRTHDMSADIYTKGFTDVALFNRLRALINVFSPPALPPVGSILPLPGPLTLPPPSDGVTLPAPLTRRSVSSCLAHPLPL